MPVSRDLIIDQGEALQGIAVTPERAAQLADEVERINTAIRAAAERLTFDDDPGAFLRTVAALKDG
jgi:hypothetical protein